MFPLSSKRSLNDAVIEWGDKPLHVLVNLAAEAPKSREVTNEGLERQFATNILSYFRLSNYLRPSLALADSSRIINVASYWAGGLFLADLQFERRPYDNQDAYRQSKQANRMLTIALANKLRNQNIEVVSCHPGDVSSGLSNDLGFGGHESAKSAAETPLWLVGLDADIGRSGKYFSKMKIQPCEFSHDREEIQLLYSACQRFL